MPNIKFAYPVHDFQSHQHIGDLTIHALVILFSDGRICGVNVIKVFYDGVDVLHLIRATSPDEWETIQGAAGNHAQSLYGSKEESILDTLEELNMPQHESKEFLL